MQRATLRRRAPGLFEGQQTRTITTKDRCCGCKKWDRPAAYGAMLMCSDGEICMLYTVVRQEGYKILEWQPLPPPREEKERTYLFDPETGRSTLVK